MGGDNFVEKWMRRETGTAKREMVKEGILRISLKYHEPGRFGESLSRES